MNTLQMVNTQDYGALLTLLDRYDNFALSTHINPDGDAIGSELSLYLFLTKLGKSVKIFNTDMVPANYRFLPYWDSIESAQSVGTYRPEVLIVLDASTLERIGKHLSKILYPMHSLVNIDHHATAEAFGNVNLSIPCLLYTSPSPRDRQKSRMPSSA